MKQPVSLVDTKWGGKMFCPAGDEFVTGSFERWGVYSETEVEMLKQVVGNSLLVCGANIGGVAVPVGLTKEVIAVEAQPVMAELLKANIAVNYARVEVMNRAVGKVTGERVLIPTADFGKHFNFGRVGKELWGQGVGVETITIDDLCDDRYWWPDTILLDIEGMECEALHGAATALERAKTLWVECDREDQFDELYQLVTEAGFTPKWAITLLKPSWAQDDPWPLQASFNWYCYKGEDKLEVLPVVKETDKEFVGRCPVSMIYEI